jgi:hypothetical protein
MLYSVPSPRVTTTPIHLEALCEREKRKKREKREESAAVFASPDCSFSSGSCSHCCRDAGHYFAALIARRSWPTPFLLLLPTFFLLQLRNHVRFIVCQSTRGLVGTEVVRLSFPLPRSSPASRWRWNDGEDDEGEMFAVRTGHGSAGVV